MSATLAVEAESHVLAACLAKGLPALATTREHLQPAHLQVPAHRHILAAMYALSDRGATPDMVSLPGELAARGTLDACGGPVAISELLDYFTTADNLIAWCDMIREAYSRNTMRDSLRQIIEATEDVRNSPARMLSMIREAADLAEPSVNGPTKPPAPIPGPAFARRVFPTRDPLIGSGLLHAGELALLYATSGLGKTFYSEQLGHAVANGSEFFGFATPEGGVPVLIVQLEVDPWRLQQRRAFRWPHGVRREPDWI